jgi:hypothetical protein
LLITWCYVVRALHGSAVPPWSAKDLQRRCTVQNSRNDVLTRRRPRTLGQQRRGSTAEPCCAGADGQADLPGALLVWANERELPPLAPLLISRKRGADGGLKAISRVQAWTILKAASELADVRVLALRASRHGPVGQPVPAHPHLFRHARVRQIVRTTRSLPLAQRQAGWSRLQMAYLTVGDEEARRLMQDVPE